MTDKEFKRLSRAQLVDIIYRFQLQVDELTEENQILKRKLADKRLRMNKAGNIARAALEINNCFSSAQKAAEQYLNEIKKIREETEAKRQKILADAQAKADAIISDAKKHGSRDSAIDDILKKYSQKHSDNG